MSGKPLVAIEGDSAFDFSGMEIETNCRYHLPIVVVIFNNGCIYRGDGVNRSGDADPPPTVLMSGVRYDKLIEAFGSTGYHLIDPRGFTEALGSAIRVWQPGPHQLRHRIRGRY